MKIAQVRRTKALDKILLDPAGGRNDCRNVTVLDEMADNLS